jgi:hypothetical protein
MNEENLFDDDNQIETDTTNDPRKEWVGMPEFVQEKQKPFAQIIFRFDNENDLNEFSKLIGQKLTPKTKSAWHPQLVRGLNSGLRYVDAP